jgi:hypothetical protein
LECSDAWVSRGRFFIFSHTYLAHKMKKVFWYTIMHYVLYPVFVVFMRNRPNASFRLIVCARSQSPAANVSKAPTPTTFENHSKCMRKNRCAFAVWQQWTLHQTKEQKTRVRIQPGYNVFRENTAMLLPIIDL